MLSGLTPPSLNILLIDNEPVSQQETRRLLEKDGHVLVLVDTFEAALKKVRCFPFELILLDVQMQNGLGFNLAQQLKSLPDCTGLAPIMALSSTRNPADVKRCFQVGLSNFLPKPLCINAFHEAILPYIMFQSPYTAPDLKRTT